MSSIIIPRRALMQPQGRVVASRDFQASFLFNAASPYVDHATGREFTLGPDAQNAPFRPTKQGVGYFPLDTNVTTLFRVGFLNKPEIIPGAVTLIAQVQGALYDNHDYFSMGGDGRGIGLRLNGAYIETGAAVLVPRVTYLGIADYTLPTTGLKPLDEPVTLVVVTRAGSIRVWANGVFLGSVAAGTPVATLVDDSISVGYLGGASNGYRGGTTCFAVLPVPVEDDTAQSLSRNPWQLFESSPRRLYFDVPAGATTVSADGVLRWSLTSAVQADQALRWSLNALAQRDTTLMWSLLQTAQSDATARWSLIAAINADAALRWSLVEAVQADAALRWSMLAAVSADTTLLWDMAGATGVVSRDFAARWSMLAPVSADAAFHWSLLNAVARDQALPWSMVQAIASDVGLRWSLIQAVQADAEIAWSLLQAVSRDSMLAWDIAESLGTVAASLSLRWSLIAAVQQSIDARWSLLASVGADADMRWDMLTSLTAELLARWNIIGRAVADQPMRWDLIAASATDLVIRWQVGEVFDLVVRKRFVSGASMRRSFVV